MSSSMITRALLLCCSVTALAVPTLSHAQDTAPQAGASDADLNSQGNEIVVTATRRAEKLQDVAMSVNVATGEQIQKLNIFNAKDVQQLAPGLEMTNTTGRNNTTTLRGVTFDPDQGTSPAVQVYFNEIPTDAQTAFTAIYDIDQINVLRGPQGLLRGLSAPAGSITFATRRPGFDAVEGYMQATGTSRAGYNVQGAVTLPFSDKVSLRVAGLVDGNRLNNVRDINRGNDRSSSRTESFRVTLGLRPTDNFSAYLTYQYLTADDKQYQQVMGPGGHPSYQLLPLLGFAPPFVPGTLVPDTTESSGPPLAVSDYAAVSEGLFRNRNKSHIVNLAVDYDLGPATLSFVGAHQYSVLKTTRDLDAGNAVPNYVFASSLVVPYKVDTGELRLTSNNAEGLGWGIGAFYNKQSGTTVVNQAGDSFFFPTSVVTTPFVLGDLPYLPVSTRSVVPVDTSTWSFNANLRYVSGPLKIEGGIRYSIIKSLNTTTIDITSPGNTFAGVPAFTQTQQGVPTNLERSLDRPWTGGVDISYAVTPDLNVYAAYGHSFRAGSVGVAVPVGVSNDLIKTHNETTDSWEVGLKGSAFNRRLSFTLSAYYQKLNGFLSRFTSISYSCPQLFGTCSSSPLATPADNHPDGGFDFNYNGNATIKGIELTLDGRPTRNWDFGVSAAYTHARYDNALLPCNDYAGTGVPNENGLPTITGTGNVSFCRSNGRLAEVPDFSLTANTEIRFPTGGWTPFVRALFTYRPGFFSDRVNYNYQDRELLNLFLGVRSPDAKWEFDVFARNLLNQQRITNISLGTGQQATAAGIPYNSGYYLINAMNPREFGATLNFKW